MIDKGLPTNTQYWSSEDCKKFRKQVYSQLIKMNLKLEDKINKKLKDDEELKKISKKVINHVLKLETLIDTKGGRRKKSSKKNRKKKFKKTRNKTKKGGATAMVINSIFAAAVIPIIAGAVVICAVGSCAMSTIGERCQRREELQELREDRFRYFFDQVREERRKQQSINRSGQFPE